MKNFNRSACALALLAVTSLPAMAESVDLTVKGTIIPAACVPTLTDGGVVDYGYIKAQDLKENNYTLLAPKELTFSIKCDAPAKVGIIAVNSLKQDPAGVVGSGVNHAAVAPSNVYQGITRPVVVSMGLDNEAPIGGYAVTMKNGTFSAVTATGSLNVTPIFEDQTHPGTLWTVGGTYDTLFGTGTGHVLWSWASSGTNPVAFEALTGQLEVQAYVNHTSKLGMANAIQLNGLTTIELVYL